MTAYIVILVLKHISMSKPLTSSITYRKQHAIFAFWIVIN